MLKSLLLRNSCRLNIIYNYSEDVYLLRNPILLQNIDPNFANIIMTKNAFDRHYPKIKLVNKMKLLNTDMKKIFYDETNISSNISNFLNLHLYSFLSSFNYVSLNFKFVNKDNDPYIEFSGIDNLKTLMINQFNKSANSLGINFTNDGSNQFSIIFCNTSSIYMKKIMNFEYNQNDVISIESQQTSNNKTILIKNLSKYNFIVFLFYKIDSNGKKSIYYFDIIENHFNSFSNKRMYMNILNNNSNSNDFFYNPNIIKNDNGKINIYPPIYSNLSNPSISFIYIDNKKLTINNRNTFSNYIFCMYTNIPDSSLNNSGFSYNLIIDKTFENKHIFSSSELNVSTVRIPLRTGWIHTCFITYDLQVVNQSNSSLKEEIWVSNDYSGHENYSVNLNSCNNRSIYQGRDISYVLLTLNGNVALSNLVLINFKKNDGMTNKNLVSMIKYMNYNIFSKYSLIFSSLIDFTFSLTKSWKLASNYEYNEVNQRISKYLNSAKNDTFQIFKQGYPKYLDSTKKIYFRFDGEFLLKNFLKGNFNSCIKIKFNESNSSILYYSEWDDIFSSKTYDNKTFQIDIYSALINATFNLDFSTFKFLDLSLINIKPINKSISPM